MIPLQLSIICENTVGRPIAARGEHGFSGLLQTSAGNWLFDTGSGETLLENLELLGHDAQEIDGVVLSHGHYDHCGGLLPLLQKIGPRPVFAHPQIFDERFWQGQHERRDISLPFSRRELEEGGARFRFRDQLTELADGLYFSGTIPRHFSIETGDPHLVRAGKNGSGWEEDPFPDDAALALETKKGWVIILGCAHSGLINTVEHLRKELSIAKIHAIIGGTHLGPASDEQFAATVDYLSEMDVDRIGVSHCTGQLRSAQLYAHLPKRVFFASVGSVVKF